MIFVNNETGCPDCCKHGYCPGLPGTFYVVHWYKSDNQFLKYGITNVGKSRIRDQHNKTEYVSKILFFSEFVDGNIAIRLEKDCNKRRNDLYGRKGYIAKEEFPDGHTETMSIDQWEWLYDLLYENTMIKLKTLKEV